jgi:hypothetical protein
VAGRDQFRSGLERRIAGNLQRVGAKYDYEAFKVPYTQPVKQRLYLIDFILPNGIIIEAKGRWESADRQKFVMIKDSWPDLDIRFVFSRSASTISKTSKTTYADYCESHGWLYADGAIPFEWISAPPNEKSIAAIRTILRAPVNQRKR